jgi:hypothetical protein
VSAADDVDAASDKVRGCVTARHTRVDRFVAGVNDRIAPTDAAPRLHLVSGRES